jgi:hypothetical protein
MTDQRSRGPDDVEREKKVDEEMAAADKAYGERREENTDSKDQKERTDPDAPGTYVDRESATDVAEPNEPA